MNLPFNHALQRAATRRGLHHEVAVNSIIPSRLLLSHPARRRSTWELAGVSSEETGADPFRWLMKTLTRAGSTVLIFTLAAGILAEEQLSSSRGSCPACGAALISGPGSDADADGLDSSTKVFHHYGIHSHVESYLVFVSAAEKTGGGKNEMEIKTTIVDRINGRRTVGERLVFRRVSDASPEAVSRSIGNMPGRLYYVFLNLQDGGALSLDRVAQEKMPTRRWLMIRPT